MAHALLLADKGHSPLRMDPCVAVTAIVTRKMECDFFTLSLASLSVKGKTDYAPPCVEHADEYRKWENTIKFLLGDCWLKGVLRHTDSGEVRGSALRARDRLLQPTSLNGIEKTPASVSDSEMATPPTPMEKQYKSEKVRSLSSPPK